jgi:TPR repeat protein
MYFPKSEELAKLRQWYWARDVFLDVRGPQPNYAKGLALARKCDHDDARWLCGLFPEGSPTKGYEVIAKFKQISDENPQDIRALAYYGFVITGGFHESGLARPIEILAAAAVSGNPLAQAWYSRFGKDPSEKLAYAEKSAKQGEPYGFFQLADCVAQRKEDFGDEVETRSAVEIYRQGADLGNPKCMECYGIQCFGDDEPEGYFWTGMASLRGGHGLNYFYGWMVRFFESGVQYWDGVSDGTRNQIVYIISYIINEYQRMDPNDATSAQHECFGNIEKAYEVAWFYPAICQRARSAVDTWTVIGRRLGVSRDIRRLIGQLVWDLKRDADYKPGFSFDFKAGSLTQQW